MLAAWGPNPGHPADFDGNGFVNGYDLMIWQRGLGLTGQADNSAGDADGNGIVNAADLAIWRSQFGGPPIVGSDAGTTAVPEPISAALLLLGSLLCLRSQRQIG